jgi:hypothetical protein
MNPFILALIIGMAFANFQAFLGILGGIILIWGMTIKEKPNPVVWHFTHWSWWNIRV